MAYGVPYFPNGYGQQFQPMQQLMQPQTNNIVHVQNEQQARAWTVAPNSSVMFIDDSSPHCYTKTMGMSQLEPPIFKCFKLVEVESSQQPTQETKPIADLSAFMTKEEFEPYKAIIDDMQKIAKELGNG